MGQKIMTNKRQSLGKGLDALMGDYGSGDSDELSTKGTELAQDRQILDVPVEFLQRGKYQPRRDLDRDTLDELALSIAAQGVMQPIAMKSLPANAAGEQLNRLGYRLFRRLFVILTIKPPLLWR